VFWKKDILPVEKKIQRGNYRPNEVTKKYALEADGVLIKRIN
tara:strand:- start:3612 stop:3737 length:126 start_codon:yes stop_codon:yes gene_type:complete